MLARLGGDEFLILLPELDGRRPRRPRATVADEVAARLSEPFKVSGAEFPRARRASASRCTPRTRTRRPSCSSTPTWRCTRARAAGARPRPSTRRSPTTRSSACRCRRGCGARSPRTSSSCYYQPIVELATGRLAAMEALLRWNDPDRGLVFPDDFIPAAEEMSLLEPIGDWVLGALAQQMLEWREAGPRAARLLQRLAAPAAPPRLRRRARRAARGAGHRPVVADDGADRVGHAARARADRPDPARARRERAAAGDRRLRGGLVLALAAARCCRCTRSRSTARSCARSPRTRRRARSSTR